ncbi:hypothetical protein Tco_1395186 [Tanacetum coccineum]
MSSSTDTYTFICSDSDLSPWGFHLMDPAEFEAPPSPDYVSGPEHPPSPDYVPGPEEPEQAPLSPDYVPEPEYPEYLVPSDAEAPIEDQPLPDDASPTALSPGYIADSDPEEDPEEDPADYPADGGDDDDDESSDDDDDEEEQEASKDDDEEEEEHPAPADSSVVPVDDHVPSAEDTEAFETDESAPTPVPSPRRRRARISVRPQTLMSAATKALIAAVAAALPSSPPPSPLTLLSSLLPWILSPPLPLPSPPTTSPTYDEAPLGYRVAKIRLRVASPSTHHPSEIPSSPMLLPSTSHRYDTLEADMPLQKRARFTASTGRFEDGMVRDIEERAPTTVEGLSQRVTDLSTTLAQDTHEIYVRLEDAQDDRALQRARVNTLFRDRRYHLHTAVLIEREARKCHQTTTTTAPMTNAAIKQLIPQGVADALAEIKTNRTSRNGDDSHDLGIGSRRTERATRECTYTDFLKCQPLNFKGTKGVVGLTQWFEKMESVFHISNCTVACQMKFATCTLQGNALTLWNSHVRTVDHDAAYAMTWKTLKKIMTDKYCPRGENRDQEA